MRFQRERAELKSIYSAEAWKSWVDYMDDVEVFTNLHLAKEARKRES